MKIRLAVQPRPIECAPEGDAAVCAVAQDERPLRGPAGRLDWRLCGLISRQLLQQRYEGRPGEDMLLNTGHRLPFGRLFLVGLGRTADLDPAGARRMASRTGATVVRAGAGSVVLGLWDLTRERVEFPESLNAFLIGCGTARAQGAPVDAMVLSLLARNPAEVGRLRHDLDRIARRPPVDGMELIVDPAGA